MTKKKDSGWTDIDGGSAFVIPLSLLRHPNMIRLSPYGHKLIHDLARQYSGFNNGYLCASFTLMHKEGWKSSETLWRTIRECEHYKLLERTRQGDKNKASLHAFTWRRINEKPDKPLDVRPTMKPGDDWKEEQPPFELKIIHRKKGTRRKRILRAA